MPTRSKSKRCIQVIDASRTTTAEERWVQTLASFARAHLATRCMETSGRIPHRTTRLIN